MQKWEYTTPIVSPFNGVSLASPGRFTADGSLWFTDGSYSSCGQTLLAQTLLFLPENPLQQLRLAPLVGWMTSCTTTEGAEGTVYVHGGFAFDYTAEMEWKKLLQNTLIVKFWDALLNFKYGL